jgi:chaperone BCS1
MELLKLMSDNPMVTGALIATVSGSLMWVIKAIPLKIYGGIVRLLTVSLHVSSETPIAFSYVNTYLISRGYSDRTNRLKIVGNSDMSVAPGEGSNFFWDGGLVSIYRKRNVAEGKGAKVVEDIHITTYGKSSKRIKEVLRKCRELKTENRNNHYYRPGYWGDWEPVNRPGQAKSLDSVILSSEAKTDISKSVEGWLAGKDFYSSLGIPWNHGLLLYGPPGTGKTTLVKALSGKYSLPVHALSLEAIGHGGVLKAFSEIEENSIVLIEDVDRYSELVSKKLISKDGDIEGDSLDRAGVSLATLLNAIDGVLASEGRLLILTTNHLEKLDPALIRPGRIDKKVFMGNLNKDMVYFMASKFFDKVPSRVISMIEEEKDERPPAYWQVRFLEARNGA